jgi:aspartate/methionine/tyrosine aminotransferase
MGKKMPKTDAPNKSGKEVPFPGNLPDLQDLLGCKADNQTPLERLLFCLDERKNLPAACALLHALADKLSSDDHQSNLTLRTVAVPGAEAPLKLLLSPAVFSPEDWGKAFAEGLMKAPELLNGRKIVELGTGSGWISLLLLLRTNVAEILALDINPKAILIAKLNTYLNGTTAGGDILLSRYGSPIIGAVEFCESDLLGLPLERGSRFDHVIGCIPQVLHPDSSATLRTDREASEADLYDLSNYCFEQGILEDRFGLPLIARALEESQLCLNPGGKVTLVLGGRPGPTAIESMFGRRGFDAKLIWSRRIQQADDTDLASLVALERAHDIQFHFFMCRNSHQSISAATAVKLLENNKNIFHDLLVYQAETRWEQPTFAFVRDLHKMKLDSLRNELDFSRIAEEQVSFLSRLSSDMLASKKIPYTHERGDLSLRQRLSKFLSFYCHYEAPPDSLFIAPERSQLVAMVLRIMTQPGDQVLISQSLRSIYQHLFEPTGLNFVTGNDDLTELLDLSEVLKPRVVLIAPAQLAAASPLNLKALEDHARRNLDRLYIVDDSSNFDISSDLNSNMNLRLAAQLNLPPNLMLLYGLIKNTVCPDLELSFILNAPAEWASAFDVAAELSYSRISYPSQLYYEWLLDGLLSFPFPHDIENPTCESDTFLSQEYAPAFVRASTDPVFATKPIDPEEDGVIRLDYGEFEAPVPDAIVKGLFKGFLEWQNDGLDALVRNRVAAYLKATRQAVFSSERIVLSQGVFPLFGALISALRSRLKRPPVVALASGSYGPIYPTIAYYGGIVKDLETDASKGFLLNSSQLLALTEKPDLLWLTQPNNPSGLFFEPKEVQSIAHYCRDNDVYLLADEIFLLLSDHRLGAMTPPYLSFASTLKQSSRNVFIVDGISKAFAAGGMRCGFMLCPDADWAREIQRCTQLPPRSGLRAWDALYSAFLDASPHQFVDIGKEKQELEQYLDFARKRLSNQRDELVALLKKYNLDDGLDTPYRGGFFLLAKLDEEAVDIAIQTKMLVNPPEWGRTPGWSRICYSLEPDKFKEAMARLQSFFESRN